MAPTNILFSLIPETHQAVSIIEANPKYQQRLANGMKILSFPFNFRSKYPSRFLSFGKANCHDVILPSSRHLNDGTGTQEDYRNDHFFFYMAKDSGELILRDVSGKTAIFHPQLPGQQDIYRLHGSPPHRQRVIPRMNIKIVIVLGSSTQFGFRWQSFGSDEPANDDLLSQRATSLAVTGATITDPSIPASDMARQISRHSQYRLPSQYTPTVSSETRCDITFHRYRSMGQGSFGVVHKVVDLRNGNIWALKEIKLRRHSGRLGPPGSEERRELHELATSLKQEVEMIFPLKHKHIAELHHFQDFRPNGKFQVFFRLYRGNVEDLIDGLKHSCDKLDHARLPPTWAARFMRQVPEALEFLHSKGVIHRDIKPANILYDLEHRAQDTLTNFYVSDFGLSVAVQEANNPYSFAGTAFFMPPEAALEGELSPVFDIWSLGITLGCMLGYWCYREMGCSKEEWDRKLKGFGSKFQLTEAEHATPEVRWPQRVRTLIDCLPPGFRGLLAPKNSRSSPGGLLRVADPNIFWKLPPKPLAVQSPKRHPNDSMSVDGHSGDRKGKQPMYPSAMSLDIKSPVQKPANAGPAQPSKNRGGNGVPAQHQPGHQGANGSPAQPRPQHQRARVSPAQAPGNQGAKGYPAPPNPKNGDANAGPALPRPGQQGVHVNPAQPLRNRGAHAGLMQPQHAQQGINAVPIQPPKDRGANAVFAQPRPQHQEARIRPAQPLGNQVANAGPAQPQPGHPVIHVNPAQHPGDRGADIGPVQPHPAQRAANAGPTQPPRKQGANGVPAQPHPGHQGAHVSPAQPPGDLFARAGPILPAGRRGAAAGAAQTPGYGANAGPAQVPGNGGANAGPGAPGARNTGPRQVRGLNRLLAHRNNPPPEEK